jgi:dethiobiotin synthetase
MTGPRKKSAARPRRSTTPEVADIVPAAGAPVTLVVGTDTSVGKTYVTAALARALLAAGQRVVAIKPVETGTALEPGDHEDGVLLARATGQEAPRAALVRLRPPIGAATAADADGVKLDVHELSDRIRELSRGADQVLVELVGGLLSPFTWEDDALDFAHLLDARAVVVGADRLGTINHILLTLRALRDERIPVMGVVLSAPEHPDPTTGTNADAIRRLSGLDAVVTVPFLADPVRATEALKEVAGWLLD